GVEADEHGGKTDEGMKSRHELRHFRHLDTAGEVVAEHSHPGVHQENDEPVADTGAKDGCNDRERHADNAVPNSAFGAFLSGQTAEGENEENSRRDIGGRNDADRHDDSPLADQDFWNMESMRRVTRKPPTM